MEESGARALAVWSAHFGQVIAAMLLFGASLFPFYAGTHGWGLGWRRFTPAVLAFILFASVMLALALTISSLTGELASLMSLTELRAFFLETSFGLPLLLRLLLSIALFASALGFAAAPRNGTKKWDGLFLLFSAGVIISFAAAGHAQSADGEKATIAIASEALHLLAAAAWIGGLPPLLCYLSQFSSPRQGNPFLVLHWFSFMGQVAVVTIIAGGVSTLIILSEAWKTSAGNLLVSDYGSAFAVKMVLLGIMLVIALLNRAVLLPRLKNDNQRLVLLRKLVLLECLIGGLVIAAGITMSASAPPIFLLAGTD